MTKRYQTDQLHIAESYTFLEEVKHVHKAQLISPHLHNTFKSYSVFSIIIMF